MPEIPARYMLITAARLLDGTGAVPVTQAALLVKNGRIVTLGPATDVRVPDGATADRKVPSSRKRAVRARPGAAKATASPRRRVKAR